MLPVALAAATLLGLPCPARCSCLPTDEQGQFRAADAVFTARVLHVGEPEENGSGGDDDEFAPIMRRRGVRVEVLERRKGRVPDTLVVHVAADAGMCGYDFYQGRLYLIYAGRHGEASDGWSTGMCLGTKDLQPDAPPSTPPESLFVGRHARVKLPPDSHYPRTRNGFMWYAVGWRAGGPRMWLAFREYPAAGTRLESVADSLRNYVTQGAPGVAPMESVPMADGMAYGWTLHDEYRPYRATVVGTSQGTLLIVVGAAYANDRELAERTWRTVLDGLAWQP